MNDGQILESRLKKTNCLLYAGSTNDIEGRFRGSAYNGTKKYPFYVRGKDVDLIHTQRIGSEFLRRIGVDEGYVSCALIALVEQSLINAIRQVQRLFPEETEVLNIRRCCPWNFPSANWEAHDKYDGKIVSKVSRRIK